MQIMQEIGGVKMPEYFGEMAGTTPAETSNDGANHNKVPLSKAPLAASTTDGEKR